MADIVPQVDSGSSPWAPTPTQRKFLKRQARRLRRRLEKRDPENVPRLLYRGYW